MKKIFILILLYTISGCATQYQSGQFSLTGGHTNYPVTGKLEKIIFSANGFTDQTTAQKYALFRSAEYAKENNKPYFIMYPRLIHAALDRKTQAATIGSVDNKPTAFCYITLLDDYQHGAIVTKQIIDQINKTNNINSDR